MFKQYFNLAIVMLLAWATYGLCQEDTLLPQAAAGVILFSLMARFRSGEKQFAWLNAIPLSVIIIVSFVIGYVWRTMIPPPEETVSPFPEITAAVQAATIFAALLIWLKPFTRKHQRQLFFLAWLTVAVSINVPFDSPMLFVFCAFCVIAVAVVILNTSEKPADKKYIFRYYRDFTLYSVVLVMVTTGLFYGISKTLVIFDQVFMDLMSNYVLPRNYSNFLKIEPIMRLGSPGWSAFDRRPVLEISAPGIDGFYLKTQIFEDFDDGTWLEQRGIVKTPVLRTLLPEMVNGQMTLFTPFDEIIPTPTGIRAAHGNSEFTKSQDNVLYASNDQRTRMLEFSMTLDASALQLTDEDWRRNTAVPRDIAPALQTIADQLIQNEADERRKAEILVDFFHANFRYSLDVNYAGNNDGLLRMLLEKRPAYCTYFASAMTLLLRSQGIPSRVATGFLVNEKINAKTGRLLARVYDAHAWVEVFLPPVDPAPGAKGRYWQIMDPTPAGERATALKKTTIDFAKIRENILLAILRCGAFMENLDKEKLKQTVLILLVLFMAMVNAKKIWQRILHYTQRIGKQAPLKPVPADPLRFIYLRYEQYLKTILGETRGPAETDSEVLERLRHRPQVPAETVAKMTAFVRRYHAARFGGREDKDLRQIIQDIVKNVPSSREI